MLLCGCCSHLTLSYCCACDPGLQCRCGCASDVTVQITSLHSGALLGVAYRMPKRASISDDQPPNPPPSSSGAPGSTTAPPAGSGGSGSTTPQEPAPAGAAELSLLGERGVSVGVTRGL